METTKIVVWPDGTWCHKRHLEEYGWKSDDYYELCVDSGFSDDEIDGEFAKCKIEQEIGEINGCSGYKSPTECPHNGVFDPLSPACKECVEDATIGYDTSDIF
jgi:hypothetical protein